MKSQIRVLAEIELPANGSAGRPVIALGAELKNTICLLSGGRACIYGPFGDLKEKDSYGQFRRAANVIRESQVDSPCTIAADLHPMYLCSQYARRWAGDQPAARLIEVQHHHAHIAACLAEHGKAAPAIGIACDGTGYGADGTTWGCEILLCQPGEYRRLGHLRTIGLPGGDVAAVETYRPAVSALYDAYGKECLNLSCVRKLAPREYLAGVVEMLEAGTNCPCSSSLGRWFDALAGLCGLVSANVTEGQAPIALEAAAAAGIEDRYEFAIADGDVFQIDLRPAVRRIVADLDGKIAPAAISAKFHNTVSAFLLESALRAGRITGMKTVALSGGCFLNKYLTARLVAALESAGYEVLTHKRLPAGDACVSLGQAVVAARQENTADR